MRFLETKTIDGKDVLVNPDHIIKAAPGIREQTVLNLVGYTRPLVIEMPLEALRLWLRNNQG